MGSIARMDLQNVGTCPGRPLQILTRNHFFQNERPEPPPPPLKFSYCKLFTEHYATLTSKSSVHIVHSVIQ